ncbi:MAG: phospholipid carrier-dependent glycosyltransferase [Actinobacteria bacterium]|nr:phospholipid carrier-dependent glycosyltransferase [Actinomycetota bacterium]MSY15447.1 phospholipid carrier-dependent glycosyltransferase [Actinomycetota bacterium]
MSMTQVKRYVPITLITLFSLFLRLWNLNKPKGFIFDEVYYAKNANSLITHGVELNSANQSEFVVHPPLGKWLIGIGIKLFGNNEFGWRISAAVFGTLSILLIYLIAQRLFNSYLLSNIAAGLMALDGLNLVMSRVALLDIFLMFFILLATYLFMRNQYWLTGIALGMATGIKWSGAYLIPIFLILSVNFVRTGLIRQALMRISQFIIIPIFTYLITWSGWLFTSNGWDRNWAATQPKAFLPDVIRNLWHYHSEILNFHTGLDDTHSYSANPWSWLILGRPTSFFYETPKNCGATSCSQEILAIGTPLLWWSAVIALVVVIGYWLSKREPITTLIITGLAATYLPWFFFQSRTMFYFYAVSISPFLILALVFLISKLIEAGVDRGWIYLFISVIFLNFIYFLPIWVGIEIPYSQWLNRMWLPSWI